MQKTIAAIVMITSLAAAGLAHADSRFHGNVHALFGYKQLADSDFDDLQDQLAWGAMFDFRW